MSRLIEYYKLVDYSSHSFNNDKSTTNIAIEYKGERIECTATEEGPISAAFKALSDAFGEDIVLEDFKIQSVTKGSTFSGKSQVKI